MPVTVDQNVRMRSNDAWLRFLHHFRCHSGPCIPVRKRSPMAGQGGLDHGSLSSQRNLEWKTGTKEALSIVFESFLPPDGAALTSWRQINNERMVHKYIRVTEWWNKGIWREDKTMNVSSSADESTDAYRAGERIPPTFYFSEQLSGRRRST